MRAALERQAMHKASRRGEHSGCKRDSKNLMTTLQAKDKRQRSICPNVPETVSDQIEQAQQAMAQGVLNLACEVARQVLRESWR